MAKIRQYVVCLNVTLTQERELETILLNDLNPLPSLTSVTFQGHGCFKQATRLCPVSRYDQEA